MLENPKSYRGTWEEIASHKDDLPPNAILEIRVVAPQPQDTTGVSLYERFKDVIGTVDGLPSDLSTNPKYMEGFGETKSMRTFD